MTDITPQSLSRAYELIEADKLTEAQLVLEPILADEKDNVDAWWLYAHAVVEPEKAQLALQNVLRLDANYPGAAQLMTQVRQKTSLAPDTETFDETDEVDIDDLLDDLETDDEISSDFDDLDIHDDFEIDDIDEGDKEPAKPNRRTLIARLMLLLIVVLLIIVAVGVLTRQGTSEDEPTPTSMVAQSLPTSTQQIIIETTPETTPEAVSTTPAPTVEPTATTESATVDPLSIASDNLLGQLDTFRLPTSNAIEVRDSELGSTMIVAICVVDSTDSRAMLNDAMASVVQQSASFTDLVDAIGVSLTDCEQNSEFNTIAVPVDIASQFDSGTITEADFLRAWRAIGR